MYQGFHKICAGLFLGFLLLCLNLNATAASSEGNWKIDFPHYSIRGITTELSIEWLGDAPAPDSVTALFLYGNISEIICIRRGSLEYGFTPDTPDEIHLSIGDETFSGRTRPLSPWVSIIPPLLAIIMALVFREVYSALFLGLLLGTSAIAWSSGLNIFASIGKGFLLIADTYLIEAALSREHLSIIIFSLLIGGMVHLISRNGGMRGVVIILSRFARTAYSAQIVTWILGMAIFFDDYANTLVVGNTMRPVTDKLKISREKLAYIVDSTAAPVASIAFITTWIGAELSYIQDGVRNLGLDESAYSIFLNSLQYAYYPIFTLIFIFLLVRSGREFGPMLSAERKARAASHLDSSTAGLPENELDVPAHIIPAWYNAVIPVLIVVLGAIAGLMYTGLDSVGRADDKGLLKNLSAIIGASDSFRALLWSSLAGVSVAVLMSVSQRLLSLRESMESLIRGFQTLLTAIVILILAWSLALITDHLHTANFLSSLMIEMQLSPVLVPVITFLLAALVSFSTGSSWGTMAILYPLLLPASWMIGESSGMEYAANLAIFHNTISAVLAGSVLGDHCSPISDTTILSSLASSCNHLDHVRTQLPYALTVGTVALFAGTLPAALGVSSWIIFPFGILLFWMILRFLAKPVNSSS